MDKQACGAGYYCTGWEKRECQYTADNVTNYTMTYGQAVECIGTNAPSWVMIENWTSYPQGEFVQIAALSLATGFAYRVDLVDKSGTGAASNPFQVPYTGQYLLCATNNTADDIDIKITQSSNGCGSTSGIFHIVLLRADIDASQCGQNCLLSSRHGDNITSPGVTYADIDKTYKIAIYRAAP
jgi:hypothetical protein